MVSWFGTFHSLQSFGIPLQQMTSDGFLSESRQENCKALLDAANNADTGLLFKIPRRQQASKRYAFYSVYSGATRWWSIFERTVVTVDTLTSKITCRCRLHSCDHRSIVRWWMFQQGELQQQAALSDDLENGHDDNDAENEREENGDNPTLDSEGGQAVGESVSPQYPPTEQALSRMIDYIYSQKTVSPEMVAQVNYDRAQVPVRLVPSETICFYCNVPLCSPTRITRQASVINLDVAPTHGIETFCKYCPDCATPYRYQDLHRGIFNYNDRMILSLPVLMEMRSALVNHTAIGRVVSMLEYRLNVKVNHQDMLNAYFAFEALVDHGYGYSCVRCGHHPKVLIHDLTKKAVFKYEASSVSPPSDIEPTVDADKFWSDVHKEIIARGVLNGRPNPFKIPPSYERWAPYIGPQTRGSRLLYNTEYQKITHIDPQDHSPIPDEVVTHLLADEKVDTVRRFCKILGLKAHGSKLDILCRLRDQSVSKAKFDHAYTKLYGHSGGWLSSTCPHNITYAVKFLLRSESPRDYIDVLRSMKHIPTVNIADIAHSIAKLGNRTVPGMFTPKEGRIAEDTPENLESAKNGTLKIDLPFLGEQHSPVENSDAHPVTGSSDRYMLFDWFHQDNCKQPKESLRRASSVKQLAGRTNTQAAEQLHSDKAKDIYWLNEMSPSNHVFAFRLVTHLKNKRINDIAYKRQKSKLSNLTLNHLGQLRRAETLSPVTLGSAETCDPEPETLSHASADNSQNCRIVPDAEPSTTADESHEQPSKPAGQNSNSVRQQLQTPDRFTVKLDNATYYKHQIIGDGNCFFRTIAHLHESYSQNDHVELRRLAYDYCVEHKIPMELSDEEIWHLGTTGEAVGRPAIIALSNVLKSPIRVVYQTRTTGTNPEHELFTPALGNGEAPMATLNVYFTLTGHYDALQTTQEPNPIYNNWHKQNTFLQAIDRRVAESVARTQKRTATDDCIHVEQRKKTKRKQVKCLQTVGT